MPLGHKTPPSKIDECLDSLINIPEFLIKVIQNALQTSILRFITPFTRIGQRSDALLRISGSRPLSGSLFCPGPVMAFP
jgi:hypothetical protein